jgi:type I restriction enzyme, S subunit
MTYARGPIGGVATVLPGFAFKSEQLGEVGTPVLKIANIGDDGTVDLANAQRLPDNYLEPKHEKFRVYDGDILLAMTGATAGKAGRVRAALGESFLLNQRVAKLIPEDIHPDYFWQVVSKKEYRERFFGLGGGAAQPNMSGSQIAAVEIPIPSNLVQKKIADILSAYDDLIENNRRRIALLEEAARMLYREWFVRFRFPGHEHVKIIDGIPEGWDRRRLGGILTLKRGYDLPEANRVTGEVPILSSSGITGFHNQYKAQGPGVVTGRYGTLGEVYYIEEDFWPLNTALYVKDFQGSHPLMIFHLLKVLLKGVITQKAAVPGVDRNVLHAMIVIWPPLKLRNSFVEIVSDYEEQLRVLGAMNQKLAAARDLLLPRLMNGEIAV